MSLSVPKFPRDKKGGRCVVKYHIWQWRMEQELSDNDQVVEWARGVADLLDDEAEEELMLEEAFAESSRPKKRRKSSGTSSTKQRAPQKMFYQEQVEHGPLTTNIARQVEMLDPREANMLDCIPLKVFKSCSDAARETGINRTKLSRSKFEILTKLKNYMLFPLTICFYFFDS